MPPIPSTLADCIQAIAKDPSSAGRLAAVEAHGPRRSVSYGDLHARAGRVGQALLHLVPDAASGQTVCLLMQRTIDWYVTYIAASRVGIPIVAASRDHPDKAAELSRFRDIVSLLNPVAVITDIDETGVDPCLSTYNGTIICYSNLIANSARVEVQSPRKDSVLAFHFTGGTTSVSKCVHITNAMAIHEIAHYPSIIPKPPLRVLQNSSAYWPASAFGQIDIAIAFKACLVLSVSGGASPDEIAEIVSTHAVDCIGVVPSVLRSLIPAAVPSLRTVFTWGEPLTKPVALNWCNRVALVDLLIATEYWLSMYAVIRGENWAYSIVDGVEIHVEKTLADSNGSTLWLSGPMVTCGYVGDVASDRFKRIGTDVYFDTHDAVIVTVDAKSNQQISYVGRCDDLVKVGGKFVDLRAAEVEIMANVGRGAVEECVIVRTDTDALSACFVLNRPVNVSTLTQAVRSCVASIPPSHVHILKTIPTNPATGKKDIRKLAAMVADPVFSPQYTLPDSEVPQGKLLGVPNPHRWVWVVIVVTILTFDVHQVIHAVFTFACNLAASCMHLPPLTKLACLPFVTHALTAAKDKEVLACNNTQFRRFRAGVTSLMYNVPGEFRFAAIYLLLLSGLSLVTPVVNMAVLVGCITIGNRRWDIERVARTATVAACVHMTMSIGLSRSLVWYILPVTTLTLGSWKAGYGVIASVVSGIVLNLALGPDPLWSFPISVLLAVVSTGMYGIRAVPSHAFLFYMCLPWDLPWAWREWWKNVSSYSDIIWYYGKSLKTALSRFAWYERVGVSRVGRFLSTAFTEMDVVGYPYGRSKEESSGLKTSGTSTTSTGGRMMFKCDHCKRSTKDPDGAYDVFRKFSHDTSKWFCETCWWTDVIDESKGKRNPRIGQWIHSQLAGKMADLVTADGTSTREPSEMDDNERATTVLPDHLDQEHSELAKTCLECLELVGWDRAAIHANGLSSLSSLVKVSAHEQLKRRLPQLAGVSAIALFKDVYTFTGLVSAVSTAASVAAIQTNPDDTNPRGDGAGEYVINNSSAALWKNGACDWILRYQPASGVAKPEAVFENAVKALKKRHPIFRAFPQDNLQISNFLQQAISLTPQRLKPIALMAAKQLWPRICVKPFREEEPVPIKFVYVDNLTKGTVMGLVDDHRSRSWFEPPFEFVVYLPSSECIMDPPVMFIYFRVTHLFADGYCINTIASDLEAILASPPVTNFATVPTMNGLQALQDRHMLALSMARTPNGANLSASCEELTRDPVLTRVMWLRRKPVEALIACGVQLGIPTEIVMVGLVVASLAEKMNWKRMPVTLMHAMRDGINESKMIGYFSDYKDMGFINTDCSYIELFHQLATRIGNRNWREYTQTLYDHSFGRHAWDETTFPVSFNLLSHVRKPVGARIENVETYWRASPRNGLSDCRLIHMYLEETKLESEWAIRFQFSKRLFDCAWVVDYVCRSFDRTLKAVLTDPTDNILRRSESIRK